MLPVEGTLNDLIEEASRHHGDRPFMIDPRSGAGLTFRQFGSAAADFRDLLFARGGLPGDRVALCLDNGLELAAMIAGAWMAGTVAVPLPPGMKDAELSGTMRHASPRFVISAAGRESPGSSSVRLPHLSAESLLQVDDSAPRGSSASGAAVILYTSGSTQNRKGALLNHESLLNSARNIVSACAITPADVTACTTPMAHNIGLLSGLIVPLLTGSRSVMPPAFEAEGFPELLERHSVTWLTSVPTVLRILLGFSSDEDRRRFSLRLVRVAGGPLPVAVRRAFEERFKVPVIFAYGMTEGGVITSNTLASDRPGSVGRACGRMEVQVVDASGTPLRPGETGEVRARGASVFLGYVDNERATRETLKDGWLHTGDLGHLDQDGFLFISGRIKEVLNIGGKKVAYREIEETIERLPGVETAIVAGDSQTIAGERVIAFVKLRPGATLSAEDVIRHCDASLADFKVPRRVIPVSDFPLSDSGKILRNSLLERHGLKPATWET